ncbi:MAG: hypothetical protein JO356_02185 [Acidobacteria bacterium]|nr:hypothetical protein [Acidobacteriota bacterium]
MLDLGLLALLGGGTHSREAALYIIHGFKAVTQLLFLLGAVRAPPSTVHFDVLSPKTLGK